MKFRERERVEGKLELEEAFDKVMELKTGSNPHKEKLYKPRGDADKYNQRRYGGLF